MKKTILCNQKSLNNTVYRRFLIILLIGTFFLWSRPEKNQPKKAMETELTENSITIIQDLKNRMGIEQIPKVFMKFETRKGLQKNMKKIINQSWSRKKIRNYEKVLRYLQLIPKNYRLWEETQKIFFNQMAGTYVPKVKSMFLLHPSEIKHEKASFAIRILLIHELTHAMQDSYINLDSLLNENQNPDPDIISARQAALEGQATAMMMQCSFGMDPAKMPAFSTFKNITNTLSDQKKTPKINSIPAYLAEKLIFFPYFQGGDFYQQFLKNDSMSKPIDLLKRLPVSSEQILHFSKYLQNELPHKLTLLNEKEFMGPDWKLIHQQNFGEIDWRILLSEKAVTETASWDAEGWDGATLYLFENLKKRSQAMIMLSSWDTAEDLQQVSNSYAILLQKKYPRWVPVSGDYYFGLEGNLQGSYLISKGCQLTILESIPLSDKDKLLKDLKNRIDL